MRLRSYTGRTMSEAMGLVRKHLGPEAIIVSTQEDPEGGIHVTAALDFADPPAGRREAQADTIDALGEALGLHGISPDLVEKIVAATLPFASEEPVVALSSALATLCVFRPVMIDERQRAVLLVGPPGAGKTVTIAKLATRAVLAGERVRLVTADTARAGGVEQLEAFARILKLPLDAVASAPELGSVAASAERSELMLIDSPGVNPYSADDRGELADLIAASGAEPILVLAAGGDTIDTVEMAHAFGGLGCERLVVTRLDLAHRLGSVLAAADAVRLGFAEAGVAPAIADGLTPFNPVVLARLLLSQAARSGRPALDQRGET